MPIVNDEQIKTLLADERITAITVDTNIFDEKGLQLNSPTLQALAALKAKPFSFILSGTVGKEILSHIERSIETALRSAKKEIGQALYAFETDNPTRDDLLNQISGGRTASEVAHQRFEKYVEDTGCDVLDDAPLVDIATLYDDYFGQKPPFGKGKKKSEFPDALALNALERTALAQSICILVVSKDGGWQEFCEQSDRLYLVTGIERALALISDAPMGLRASVQAWLGEEGEGRGEVQACLEHRVENIDFYAYGHPTSGELEAYAWAGSLKGVEWLDGPEIDIIEIVDHDDNDDIRAVVSLPMHLDVRIPVELSFSVWDSVDKEAVGMGGREIEVDRQLGARLTIEIDVSSFGTEDEEVLFRDCTLDLQSYDIDLGEMDVFEPEDYYDEGE